MLVRVGLSIAQFREIVKCKSITTLNLSGSHLGHHAADLSQCVALESLHLDEAQIDDETCIALLSLSRLKVLSVSGNPLSDKAAAAIARKQSLREIYLANSRITKESLLLLINKKDLQWLDVSKNGFSDEVVWSYKKRFYAAGEGPLVISD
jgi:Leucine-rich repeat (LRR) protein